MAHQMSIALTDDEYEALAAEARRSGRRVEAIAHDLIASALRVTAPGEQLSSRAFVERQYREGKVLNLPTREALTPEAEAARAALAQRLAGGVPASDMVIEDRGPR